MHLPIIGRYRTSLSGSKSGFCLLQNSLQYATRVRTIKNDVSKNEANKDMQKLRRQLEYWKEQAGLTPEQRRFVDLEEITNERGEYEAEYVA